MTSVREEHPRRIAVVTGAGRGIGLGIARQLAREGCHVVMNDKLSDGLAEAAKVIAAQTGAQAVPIVADVSDRAGVERLVNQAADHFRAIDVLVNNAGWSVPVAHILEMTEEHWDTVQQNNLRSTFLCTREVARYMVSNGRPGTIINISSFGAARAHRSMSAYDASKGGIEAFTRAVALDLAPFGIRVNAVAPGAIHTEHFETLGAGARAERARPVPLARVGEPEDVAGAVAYFASDSARYVTGQVLCVDGGMVAQLRPPEMDRAAPKHLVDGLRQTVGAAD